MGSTGRKFGRKVRRRMNQFLARGCIQKREVGATTSDGESVYVGHSSFAANEAVRCVFNAIARMYAIRAGENFGSYRSLLQGDTPTPAATGYQWRFRYRTAIGGALNETVVNSVANGDWQGFAGQLGEQICSIMNNGGTPLNYFEMVDLSMVDLGIVGSPGLATTTFGAGDIKITLVGNSNMNIQNRTLATTLAGETDADVADNISNNPLVGKRYMASGNFFPYKWNNDFTAPVPMFQTDQFQGSMSIATNTTLSTLAPQMVAALQKPPPHGHWLNVYGSATERIEPGKIRRSNVKSSRSFTLAQFLTKFLPYMRTATTYAALSQDGAHMLRMGATSFFGFEKLCNSRLDEPQVSVGWEITLTTSAVAYARTKRYCAPLITIVP